MDGNGEIDWVRGDEMGMEDMDWEWEWEGRLFSTFLIS